MIDWSGVPAGEQTQIYLPAVDAEAVLVEVARLYPNASLSRVDVHTIGCTTGGESHIPLPRAGHNGVTFAGLISIALPAGIKVGEQYRLVVRQLTSASATVGDRDRGAEAVTRTPLRWRRVLGTFQINIPVSTKEAMLPTEEIRLSIFRWIDASIPARSRWHPVFRRYLDLLAKRVGELGGAPAQIEPSLDGYSGLALTASPTGVTGKVTAIVYDHFGDFEAFLLELPSGRERRFRSRETRVEAVIREAWTDRIITTIVPEPDDSTGVRLVILRR